MSKAASKPEAQTNAQPEETKATNFYAPRPVTLTRNIRGKEVDFVHQVGALSDDLWTGYFDLLNPREIQVGRKSNHVEDKGRAVRETYKKLVTEIPTGYQPYFRQTLTKENFCDLIPFSDMEDVIGLAFACEITEDESEDFFFDAEERVALIVTAPIGEEMRSAHHYFAPVTKGSRKEFTDIDKIDGGDLRRFRKTEIPLKRDYEALKQLFGKSEIAEPTGYDENGVPVWHQIRLLDYLFKVYGVADTKNG